MHAHLMRTGVGVDSVEHLYEIQKTYRHAVDETGHDIAFFTTRNMPQRANDLINGGSVYWIIKRFISARQEIIDIKQDIDEEGKKFCRITMKPNIMLVEPTPHKHIQGWRYLAPDKAPADLRPYDPSAPDGAIPPRMASDLAAAGLL